MIKARNKTGRQSYRRETIQVRIDVGYHKLLKVQAARGGETIKDVVERALTELMDSEEWEMT